MPDTDDVPALSTDDPDPMAEEWLDAPKRGRRSRRLLLAGLVASTFFLGGAKTYETFGGGGDQAAAFGPSALGQSGAQGFPPEGFAAGGLPGQGGQGGQGAGADANTGTGGQISPGDADEATRVIGTVRKIKGARWTVRDLGGTDHKIVIDDETTLTHPFDLADPEVERGDTVTVEGTEAASGRLTATAVTLR